MVEALEVHQLMNHHVVADPPRHQRQAPIQADVAVGPARTPSRALVPDADTHHGEAVAPRKIEQSCRKLLRRPVAELTSLVRTQAEPSHPRPLSSDPLHVAHAELGRRPLGPTPRDRDPRSAITVNSKHVSPGAMMANKVELNRRLQTRWRRPFTGRTVSSVRGLGCHLSWIDEREDTLHHDRISDGDSIAAMSSASAND